MPIANTLHSKYQTPEIKDAEKDAEKERRRKKDAVKERRRKKDAEKERRRKKRRPELKDGRPGKRRKAGLAGWREPVGDQF